MPGQVSVHARPAASLAVPPLGFQMKLNVGLTARMAATVLWKIETYWAELRELIPPLEPTGVVLVLLPHDADEGVGLSGVDEVLPDGCDLCGGAVPDARP